MITTAGWVSRDPQGPQTPCKNMHMCTHAHSCAHTTAPEEAAQMHVDSLPCRNMAHSIRNVSNKQITEWCAAQTVAPESLTHPPMITAHVSRHVISCRIRSLYFVKGG